MIDATLAIAVVGLAIAAANGGWTIINTTLRDRPKVKVTLGREVYSQETSDFSIVAVDERRWDARRDDSREARLHVHVANEGRHPIAIIEAGLEYADAQRIVFAPGSTSQLGHGQWHSVECTEAALGQVFATLGSPSWVYAMDSGRKIHRQPLPSFVKEWIEQLRRKDSRKQEVTRS
ncbi:MAG: hypothetical protein WEB04_02700 [Dehalococcoidia bacterium]